MFNRIVASVAVLFVVVGIVVGGTFNGTITAFKDGKITFKAKAKKGEEAKEYTFTVNDKTAFQIKGKKGTEPKESDKTKFEAALEAQKGKLGATITTDDKDTIAEKVLYGAGKKKPAKE